MLDRILTTGGNTLPTKSNTSVGGSEAKEFLTPPSNQGEQLPLDDTERERVTKVVNGLNDFLTPSQTSLKFVFHEKLNEYYVTLIDDQTKEIVREIPSKKMLDFYAAMKDYIGVLIDKKI